MKTKTDQDFLKSSASSLLNTTACVEIKRAPNGILVRDSKDKGGPTLSFTHSEWGAFLIGAKDGEFDLT
ncbi:MAG: DUF397 domain-containing protein [Jannaschia helgolandensis]|uniref:DUF397 domain-containing protein n=1 Tax=Jannaschia helgolandensis TaxID=188906 RepID=A0A1H7LD27_9RHOB|nr:DUF397 domain-containing protein [Jannaschia helgolandensis]SEK96455.1 protein of unknown function [Jannaschia helgolandensis]